MGQFQGLLKVMAILSSVPLSSSQYTWLDWSPWHPTMTVNSWGLLSLPPFFGSWLSYYGSHLPLSTLCETHNSSHASSPSLLSPFHSVSHFSTFAVHGILWLTPLFSWQTVLASSGGLYCLSGGCNGIVNISCMSLLWTTFSSTFPFWSYALLWCPAVLVWIAWDWYQKWIFIDLPWKRERVVHL